MNAPDHVDPEPSPALEHSLALDVMLIRAAVGAGRSVPAPEILSWGGQLVRRPRATGRRLADLARDAGRIGLGTAPPAPADRRFSDRAWSSNGAYRRWVQLHHATHRTAHRLLEDAALDDRATEKLSLLVDNVASALAPSNSPLNPAAIKEALDTGGASILRGLRNFVEDMSSAPRIPMMVDRSAFEVGRNLAVTPGHVVRRTELYELIQYGASTERVYATPLLMVPPTINKYYALDLAPGRSVIEYLVAAGFQVFAVSWRNPTSRHAALGLDAYVEAVIDALGTTRAISGSSSTSAWGTCSGGIITAVAAAYLAAKGRGGEVETLTLPVTLLDQQVEGSSRVLLDADLAGLATTRSARKGYLDGAALSEVFAWLRPDDLVWRYWVNNYLMGRRPPAFDLLYWNADSTRMPAALHRDFIDLALHNRLVEAGSLRCQGTPIDLGQVTVDAFVIGAAADHITPWQSCYRSTQLLGGKTEFVLSNSGHVAALVNPPDNPKAQYERAVDTPADPDAFRASAEHHTGSWWPAYSAWLTARSGDLVPAPQQAGDPDHPPLCAAPGTYVHEK
ncbi:PHA/PHB synthase family protein [Nocardioides fonticola]|uniref:PHA/PHB synthase family protein n=1 Tax=Nocardioides fonticola TaxID=450363 RepID=UPI0031E17485